MISEFLQVRGTPASGKSTLATLLGRYIRVQEPNVRVLWIGGWKLDDVAECGDGILTSKNKRVGSQARTRFFFLMKHRSRTRTWNSGTNCSKAYTTVLIVAPLPLRVMAVHLRLSTYKALDFSSQLERGSVYFPPPTGTQLRVSFSSLQSSTSWSQALSRLRVSLPSILPQHGL